MRHARRFGTAFAFAAVFVAAGSAANGPHTRTLKMSVTGSGQVATSDGMIDCSARCSASYPRGTVLRLTAEPGAKFEFVSWSGGCIGTAPICDIAVDRNTSVRAKFVGAPPALAVSVGGPGTITSRSGIDCGAGRIVCSVQVPNASTVTLTPTPSPGGRFAGWDGQCASAGTGPCTVRVGSGLTEVAAAFGHSTPQPGPQTLTVRLDPVSSARITSEPAGIDCRPTCEASFPSGTLVTLRMSELEIWQPACQGALDRCLLVLDAPTEVVVLRRPPPPLPVPPPSRFQVTVSGGGLITSSDGTIRCGWTPSVETDCGEVFPPRTRTMRLRARSQGPVHFSRWGGLCHGAKPRCTLVLMRRGQVPRFSVTGMFRRR